MIKAILSIGLGSAIGGMARYLITLLIASKNNIGFPVGTLLVNLIGCFVIGMVYGWSDKGQLQEGSQLFLATGILGGFTTFSAFSYDTITLIRSGQLGFASIYITSSVILGVMATFLGYALLK